MKMNESKKNCAKWKKPGKKERISPLIPLTSRSRKCKLTRSDRKQIRGCLGRGKRLSRDMTKKQEGNLGDDGYLHYLDCSDAFLNVYRCQNLSNYHFNYVFKYVTLNMFSLLYVNYISMKLLKIASGTDGLSRGKRGLPIREIWTEPWGPGQRVHWGRLRQVSQADGKEGRQCHGITVFPEGGGVGPCGMYL